MTASAFARPIRNVVESSRDLTPVVVVGGCLRFQGKLFNCALAIHRRRILGVTPKAYLPNYRQFYEKRQLTSGRDAIARDVDVLGQRRRRTWRGTATP